jgi:RimJ/RimL family protein N-acetyltransferase
MINQPELSDGTILVRPVRPTDVNAIYEAVLESMSELRPWMPWCHADYSIEDTAAWVMSRDEAWARGTDYGFAIRDAQTGAFLGSVGLNQIDHQNHVANLGYWVRKHSTRRGVATNATLLLARWSFDALGLQRIEIVASVENPASLRVALKAGAHREGIMRRALWLGDRAHDAVLTSLLPEDLNGARDRDGK